MSHATEILLATGNPHKLDEIRAMFGPSGWTVQGLDKVAPDLPEPVEDQPTFAGNAVLKARYYAEHTGMFCLADDSGLMVDALGGAPGVISARYAGVSGGRDVVDPANNAKLIEHLQGVEQVDRTARFICVMALCDASCTLAQTTGTIEGVIIDEPRGANGFGYDPHFYLDELGKTTAELDPDHKNRISHRGHATRAMLTALGQLAID